MLFQFVVVVRYSQCEHTLYLLCITDKNRHIGISNVCGAVQDGAYWKKNFKRDWASIIFFLL